MYLGQDIQDKIVYLSQFPNDVLAAALLFTLANNLAAQEPETDEDFPFTPKDPPVGSLADKKMKLKEKQDDTKDSDADMIAYMKTDEYRQACSEAAKRRWASLDR